MSHLTAVVCALSICTNKKCTKKARNQDAAAGPARTRFKSTVPSETEGTSRRWLTLTTMDKPFSSGSLSHPALGYCDITKSKLILPRFWALWILLIIIISSTCKFHTGRQVLGLGVFFLKGEGEQTQPQSLFVPGDSKYRQMWLCLQLHLPFCILKIPWFDESSPKALPQGKTVFQELWILTWTPRNYIFRNSPSGSTAEEMRFALALAHKQ